MLIECLSKLKEIKGLFLNKLQIIKFLVLVQTIYRTVRYLFIFRKTETFCTVLVPFDL